MTSRVRTCLAQQEMPKPPPCKRPLTDPRVDVLEFTTSKVDSQMTSCAGVAYVHHTRTAEHRPIYAGRLRAHKVSNINAGLAGTRRRGGGSEPRALLPSSSVETRPLTARSQVPETAARMRGERSLKRSSGQTRGQSKARNRSHSSTEAPTVALVPIQ